MDISKMSDQEKSVLLAKAMGWEIDRRGDHGSYDLWIDDILILQRVDYSKIGLLDSVILNKHMPNLYSPANMALAWRAIGVMVDRHTEIWDAFFDWWDLEIDPGHESAQRLWLDRVLELVIKAGIIEEK